MGWAVFSSVVDALFNSVAFVFVGAWMPFNKFDNKLHHHEAEEEEQDSSNVCFWQFDTYRKISDSKHYSRVIIFLPRYVWWRQYVQILPFTE